MHASEAISEIIAAVLNVDSAEVRSMDPGEPLNTIGMDSINCMDIVIQIEERFGVVFHDDELLLDNLNSIAKLSGIVADKLGEQASDGKEEQVCQ